MLSQNEQDEEKDFGGDDLKWDEQYDDPDAKIILVSNENVGFRVHAWTFKRNSDFIKNLLDVPSQQSIDSAPIHLDYPSDTIRTFIHHVYSDLQITFDLTTTLCQGVFDLCDRFEAAQVYTTMSKSIQIRLQTQEQSGDLDVWEIFRVAAIRDDLDLATSAIAALDTAKLTEAILFTHSKKSLDRFEGIPTRYSYNLLMARYTTTGFYDGSDNYVEAWIEQDSKGIAFDFAQNYQNAE